jgi:hypothetical protein
VIVRKDQSLLRIGDYAGAGRIYLTPDCRIMRVSGSPWAVTSVERGILFRSGSARDGDRDHRARYLAKKWTERSHPTHLLAERSNARISRNVDARNRESQHHRANQPIHNRDRHDNILLSVNETRGNVFGAHS